MNTDKQVKISISHGWTLMNADKQYNIWISHGWPGIDTDKYRLGKNGKRIFGAWALTGRRICAGGQTGQKLRTLYKKCAVKSKSAHFIVR